MGITRLTALVIGTRDDIIVTSGGPDPVSGKFMGWITLGEEDRYRPLLNSEGIYNSHEEAQAAMQKVVDDLRESVKKELNGRDPIEYIFEKTKAEKKI